MKIPVVYSTDHNFVMPTAITIKSMLNHSSDCRCEIFILQSKDVNDADRKALLKIVGEYDASISFLTMGDEFDGMFEIRDITTPAYYRLLIPWLLPDYDKVVYVDGDIIFKRSVSELFNAAEEPDKWVYGVNTMGYKKASFAKYTDSIGLNAPEYINSGVLVINASKQRELSLDAEFRKQFTKQYVYQDQDIINIVCKGHIGLLHNRYNWGANVKLTDKENLVKDPVLIHYAGPKPWKKFTQYWLDWWLVAAQTDYFDPELAQKIENETLNPTFSNKQLIKKLLVNIGVLKNQ